MPFKPRVTAVIPAYNEADRIEDTLVNLKSIVDEIIVIDDASTDNTAEIARKCGAKVLVEKRNGGYINSIKLGFKEASGEYVVTLDADGEFLSQDIPQLLEPLVQGKADMVQGSRNIIPRPSERFLTWLAKKKINAGDSGTGLRVLRADLAKSLEIKGVCICGVFSLEVASKKGRIVDLPITLRSINKPRKIAWFHLVQFFYLLPWLFRKY